MFEPNILDREQAFTEAFTDFAMGIPSVTGVEFLGSFNTPKWRPGKSDIDILVTGDVSNTEKRALREEVVKLNQLYDLKLEDACYEHPTPIFTTSAIAGKYFKRISETGHLGSMQPLGSIYTRLMKKICIPHEIIWKVEGLE